MKTIITILSIVACLSLNAQTATFTDSRDKQTYKTARIGNQVWMTENLRYKTPLSVVYDNKEQNTQKYGRLYSIADALQACPAGWKLPSDNDWQQLEAALGAKQADLDKESTPRAEGVGYKMKSNKGWTKGAGNNAIRFNALPGGMYLATEKQFFDIGTQAYFWTSTLSNKATADQLLSTIDYQKQRYAWARWLSADFSDVSRNYMSGIENYYCVRCVKAEASAAAENTNNKRYSHNGISVEIPEGWQEQLYEGKTSFMKIRPPKTGKYKFRPFVSFSKKSLSGNTLDSYYATYTKELAKNTSYSDFKITSKTKGNINGIAYRAFTYTTKIAKSGTPLQSKVVLMVSSRHRYSVSTTASPGDYNKYKPDFETIINSFKIN